MKKIALRIDHKYASLLLAVLEDELYRVAMEMEKFKGGPMNRERRLLTQKQEELENLQHQILTNLEEYK